MRRYLIPVLALVTMSFATDASGVWSTREIHAERSESIVLELGGRSPQGVVLAKEQVNGRPAFTIALFANRSPFSTTAVPRAIFMDRYLRIRGILEGARGSRKPSSQCPHSRISFQRKVAGKAKLSGAFCASTMTKTERKSLTTWYREILDLTGRP